MRTPLAYLAVCFAGQVAFAHDPITTKLTWSSEISRVVYRRCVSCHRPEGPAFSLLTYQDARPWAKGIRDEVLGRRMPPWDAVKGVGDFRDDSGLSLPEIDLIVNWVEGGAPEGDPSYLPAVPLPTPVSLRQTGTGVQVRESTKVDSPRTLRGIRPTGATEVAVMLPGGSVRRLLWIREFHPEWNRIYWLRTAERLPRGTRVLVSGAPVELFW